MIEEVSVYGFLTNTLVKIIVMIEGGDGSGGLRDSDVKLVPPPARGQSNPVRGWIGGLGSRQDSFVGLCLRFAGLGIG